MSDPLGKGPVTVELNHTLAELLVRLDVPFHPRTLGIILPVGISFFGRSWSEAALIRIAYAYEQATHHRRPPSSTPPACSASAA